MLKAQLVADAVLHYCQENNYHVSCRKLQMLMYYAQGWHLATEDEPLFDEALQAGPTGPIVPTIQKHYKGHGESPIKVSPADLHPPKSVMHRIEEIWSAYGEINDFELGKLIEQEDPWRLACAGQSRQAPPYPEITNESMWIYFQDTLAVH